jgi:hypothetical protein
MATVYVNYSSGNDSNSGTFASPVKTFIHGYNISASGGTIVLMAGSHNMGGATLTISKNITIVGEGRDNTNVTNGAQIQVHSPTVVQYLGFNNFSTRCFALDITSGTLDGFSVDECLFENTARCIEGVHNAGTLGTIKNIDVTDTIFRNLSGGGCTGIYIRKASYVTVDNCDFSNFSSSGIAYGVNVGENASRFINTNNTVKNSTFTNLLSSAPNSDDGENAPLHAIWLFGDYLNVLDNEVYTISPGKDREAVYLKASYTNILRNRVDEGGCHSQDGDIIIKASASDQNYGNVVSDNYVTSDRDGDLGYGITVYGEAQINNNTVIKLQTFAGGIYSWPKGGVSSLDGNRVVVNNGSCRLYDASQITFTNNEVSSLNSSSLNINNVSNFIQSGNTLCWQSVSCAPEFSQGISENVVPATSQHAHTSSSPDITTTDDNSITVICTNIDPCYSEHGTATFSDAGDLISQDIFGGTAGTLLSSHLPNIGGAWDRADSGITLAGGNKAQAALEDNIALKDLGTSNEQATIIFNAGGADNRASLILRSDGNDRQNELRLNIHPALGNFIIRRYSAGVSNTVHTYTFTANSSIDYEITGIIGSDHILHSYLNGVEQLPAQNVNDINVNSRTQAGFMHNTRSTADGRFSEWSAQDSFGVVGSYNPGSCREMDSGGDGTSYGEFDLQTDTEQDIAKLDLYEWHPTEPINSAPDVFSAIYKDGVFVSPGYSINQAVQGQQFNYKATLSNVPAGAYTFRITNLSAPGKKVRLDTVKAVILYQETSDSVLPDDGEHTHEASQATIEDIASVDPNDGEHLFVDVVPILTEGFPIAPEDSEHTHEATEPDISNLGDLSPNDSEHIHESTSPSISTYANLVLPDSSEHFHESISASLREITDEDTINNRRLIRIVSKERGIHPRQVTI